MVMKDNERKPSWVFDPSLSNVFRPTVTHQSEEWIFLPSNSRRSDSARYANLRLSPSVCLSDAAPGGYCKEYSKGKRPVGVMLDDTWFLKWGEEDR